jgi:stress-induced morphogen
MTPDEITARIRATLPDATVEVTDTTGGGDHFAGPVERHQLVYAALGDRILGPAAPIHALALTTRTPDETRR